MVKEDHYDVFFSYAWEDKRRATELVDALRAEGLTVFQDFSRMHDFDDIGTEIGSALDRAHTLVALYSPDFPRSPYCRLELYTALTRAHHLGGQTERVMTAVQDVRYADIRPRGLTDLRLPPRNAPAHEVVRSVATVVRRIKREDPRTFGAAPAPPEPEWWPYRHVAQVPFHGRLAELWDVRDALFSDDHQGPPVVRIIGLGGQGKTLLAVRYATTFSADHPGGVFVLQGFGSHRHTQGDPARVLALRDRQLAAIAARLGLDVTRGDAEPVDASLRSHLDGLGEPYLWLVDDLPGGIDKRLCASLLAPTANGRTLVTTRNDVRYPWGHEVPLGGLDEHAAVELLTGRRPAVGGRDREAAAGLADDLGRHALGLTVAAGLSTESDFSGYERLRADIGAAGRDVLALPAALLEELPEDHAAGLAGTLLRSINKLGGAARDVLRAASLLAPAPIPELLLTTTVTGADALASPPGVTEAAALAAEAPARAVETGLREAAGRSLAQSMPSPTGDSLWTVHALVGRTVRLTDLDQERRDVLRACAIAALTAVLERTQITHSKHELAYYVPHVPWLASDLTDEGQRHLLNEAGRVHIELGDARTALSAFDDLYRSCRGALGEDDPVTVSVLGGLAVAHGRVGDHNTALELKRRAYEGLCVLLGPDHRDALVLLNNIGVTHSDIGDHGAARSVYAEVYRARHRLLSVHHPDTLAALNNLAIATGRCGEADEAYRLKTEVHERSRRLHGDDHPLTLDALNNLGAGEVAFGDMAAAHEIFTRVHELRREILGEDHPDTLSARENAATTLGDDEQTRSVLTDVYRSRIAGTGPASPEAEHTLRSLLVSISRVLGHDAVAAVPGAELTPYPLPGGVVLGEVRLDDLAMNERIETFELAADVHEAMVDMLGPEDVETLMCRCLLAHATASLNQMDRQFDDALVLAQDAFDGMVEELGPYDPRTRLARSLVDWIKDLAGSEE